MFDVKALVTTVLTATLMTGCVLTPGSLVPTTASLDNVVVAVALPEGTDIKSYKGTVAWHRARLTVSRLDGGAADIVQPLEAVKGGLNAKAPLRGLDPNAPYRLDLELIQESDSGLESVVARGALGTDDAKPVKFKAGTNSAKIPVIATAKNALIKLEPTVLKKEKSSSSSTSIFDEDEEDDDSSLSPGAKALATIIGVVGGAILDGLLKDDDDEDEDEDK